MNFRSPFFLILFISGVIIICIGLILKKWPPKTPNWAYGYRSKSAIKSQERWDFAQLYASKKLTSTGIITVCLAFTDLLFEISETGGLFLSLGYLFVIFFVIYFKTEAAIKNRFPPNY
ncbi:SdpI family protein [Mangrovivirga halotolerans]|uniref:SdpI family protein n=1 Tax=Mangrovivirga halotolerans TaxID=2993936 RepID=UPI0034E1E559